MKNIFLAEYFFDRVVLKHPKKVLACILAAVIFLVIGAKNFRLDASAETLVLENDRDLKYARLIASRYGSSDQLILTFGPNEDLFSDRSLNTLSQIRDDLKKIGSIESVLTILDVPLLESPPIPISELAATSRTLLSPDTDRELAKKEFRESPLYSDLLISPDLKTTSIIITFPRDQMYEDFIRRRDALHEKKLASSLTAAERSELKNIISEFAWYRDKYRRQRHDDIKTIRFIMGRYRQEGTMFLGGVSMIADDMISFIKSDLRIFGIAVFFLLVITMAVIFRRLYWVIIPMAVCIVSVICTVGILGWFGWEVTVISSNFISLQLIITLAMTIHLMVRYRELAQVQPLAHQRDLILRTIRSMAKPCVYSGLTTMAGFASLVSCNIRPIISFGYIMVAGVAISIIVPFLLLPTVLVLLPRDQIKKRNEAQWSLTPALGRFTANHGRLIVFVSVVLLILNVGGMRRLQVENCFINYFRSSSEIHQGMKVIDEQLGGTTPLDIVIDFDEKPSAAGADDNTLSANNNEFNEFEEFEPDLKEDKYKYWFTEEKMEQIAAVHNYLENLPEGGKVLSVITLVRMIERINNGKALDSLQLALLFNQIPEDLKKILVTPYVSPEYNEARIWMRIRDSKPGLKRNELLNRIKNELTGKLQFKPGQVHLAGTLVLYNNMLQSLYTSQISTMGYAILFLMGAFLVLFRSLWIALIAIFPNILAVSCVLGLMGWLGIPLDMMTITIAAIGVGLADDDTIHYIHRFRHEVEKTGSYKSALHISHGSIGHAIYYTTVTLVIGFSIMSLSQFIPTIYFGLLTVVAISVALFASLTLLPELLVVFKPYGKEKNQNHENKEIAK